jgi:glutaredoxin
MKEKVIVYSMDNCGYCSQVKEVLKEKGVEFVDKSTIEHKEEWDKVTNAIHIGITPTVLFKGCYFVPNRDFQHPQQLVDLLNNYEKPTLDSNDLVLERMKTLNYNIVSALQNIDRVIKDINRKLGI